MKENKNMDKFIRESLELEKVSLDFSNKVMGKIYESETKKERALTSLLQKHTLEKPSVEFTSKIISKIHTKSEKFEYQPVIGKKAWFLISLFLLIIVLYMFVFTESSPESSNIVYVYLLKFKNLLSFNLPDSLFSPLFTVSIFALSSLLFLDSLIRNRNISDH